MSSGLGTAPGGSAVARGREGEGSRGPPSQLYLEQGDAFSIPVRRRGAALSLPR